MKRLQMILVSWVFVFVSWGPGSLPGIAEADEITGSRCIGCHTDLKGLIRLCWEVEALQPEPQASSKISGEG